MRTGSDQGTLAYLNNSGGVNYQKRWARNGCSDLFYPKRHTHTKDSILSIIQGSGLFTERLYNANSKSTEQETIDKSVFGAVALGKDLVNILTWDEIFTSSRMIFQNNIFRDDVGFYVHMDECKLEEFKALIEHGKVVYDLKKQNQSYLDKLSKKELISLRGKILATMEDNDITAISNDLSRTIVIEGGRIIDSAKL